MTKELSIGVILIEFKQGITQGEYERIYNEIYNKMTEPPYYANVSGGSLTIDASRI